MSKKAIIINGEGLKISALMAISRAKAEVKITEDQSVREKVEASSDFILDAVSKNQPIYGVTSGFGAMAYKAISKDQAVALQNNIPWFHKVGTGNRIATSDVRAAIALRINSHLRGASGIRLSMVERMATFLNLDAVPHVYEFCSIGASGDLSPLSYITACLIGLDDGWKLDYQGQTIGARTFVDKIGLGREELGPKEGLAMVNGTSVMTAIAAGCLFDMHNLLGLSFGAHALLFQGMSATNQSFHPFIHDHKPLNGQKVAASVMLKLLKGSALIADELDGQHEFRGGDEPIQDRYSLRCLPQYMGPIVDGIRQITAQVEIEMNSATDNPLVDQVRGHTYHGGNFLGQYIGVGMDQLRYHMALLAKHLDIQIAMAATPAFSNGLPAMLVGNPERSFNGGLQSLQICGNCIMPQLMFYGNSLVSHYPSHAEGFNQNINSQGYGSANLTRRAVEIFQHYIAISLLFGVQSAELRTKLDSGHFDAGNTLSVGTKDLYYTIYSIIGAQQSAEKALIHNDDEQQIDQYLAAIVDDLQGEGRLAKTMSGTVDELLHL
jgi:phenylalanine ammonia-lyase